ncbi:puratrophin-1-like isoform X2 [Onthophagus taurus]|uniref:puratrophin-1-like isoform X2 n=1 Tax=Onthophagus taurus TaxID=166361 RepID=UPI0039BEAF27
MFCTECSETVIEQIDVVAKIKTTYKYTYEVTPTGRHCLTYDEESWKPASDDSKSNSKENSPDLPKTESSKQSKTKRVKNYLKKCKNALGNNRSSADITTSVEYSSSSWYVEDHLNEGEVNEIQEDFQEVRLIDEELRNKKEKALVVEVTAPISKSSEEGKSFTKAESSESLRWIQNRILDKVSSPHLPEVQEMVEGVQENNTFISSDDSTKEEDGGSRCGDFDGLETKRDLVYLVDKYFGNLYDNYTGTRDLIVRQVRNRLVCDYEGCLQKFEDNFCVPAAILLQEVKKKNASDNSPSGWPLSLGTSAIVIHLDNIDPTRLRNQDCYVCIRESNGSGGQELVLIWRTLDNINSYKLAECEDGVAKMCSKIATAVDLESYVTSDDHWGSRQLQMLQNLLVTIDFVVHRVPLDDLTFPCPQCHQYSPLEFGRSEESVECSSLPCACQCTCRFVDSGVSKKDSSIQTSPTFEMVGGIPHIDSDEDEEKSSSLKSGTSTRRSIDVGKPRRIADLPENLLMSGINLPGTTDLNGRPIILCSAECISRANWNKYEIAKLLLYYASVASSERSTKGFTILLLSETEDYNKALELLDKAAIILGNHVKISQTLVWRPGVERQYFSSSRNQVVVLSDEESMSKYISKDQAPAICGGNYNHDQLEWVEFFKQLEPFLETCRLAGRALLSVLSHLRNDSRPVVITRRSLNHQTRLIHNAIQLEAVQELRRDGHATLTSLEERTQWLSGSMDVQKAATFAAESFSSVNRVVKRLEQLSQERKERIKELEKIRSLEKEIGEVLAWLRNVGEESLRMQRIILRSAGDVATIKIAEKDFEKFYFDAMRQLEKGHDLIEEAANVPDPKTKYVIEGMQNLRVFIRSFSERLEETRESLEDCSRCFQLLESCSDILEDDNKEQEEFKRMAFKSGNEKLIHICKNVASCEALESLKPSDKLDQRQEIEVNATSTPIKSQNTQIRRRSVSSLAFIYKCNHHAAGVSCNCCESDMENTVSYKLKKKYMQTLQNCPCKESLERKNSATLDGIKEVRESVENILEKLDKEDRCGRCDSGVSTAENSVGDESIYKKKLERSCSCQYFRESCALCSTNSSSTGSNQDHTEHQQDSIIEECSDGFVKSGSDDIEEEHFAEERRKVPPVPSNSHLHCHSSTLHLPMDGFDQTDDPKTQKTLLYIMREMIQTEQDYVKSLDYVIENYIPELLREDIPQALRGQRNVVFGNIEKIYEFHSQHFLRELEQCERHPLNVGQIFLKYDKKFYLYALYNKNKPKSDSLMSEYGSTFFKSKQIQLGDKMDLASYLLKPVQRMGKYALLLQQLMKACPELPPGASERAIAEQDDLKQAEQMVRFQLRHGNDLLAMDSIRECDVNLKEQGRLLRQNEFIVWEGKTGKKSLRQVFLFEDLILFSKARRFPDRKNLDLYIYKNSIKCTDIGLTARIGESSTKFEIWFRKRKPNDTYTLQSNSEDIKKAWSEELSQLLWKQAIRNREVRMAEMSSMGIGNKPCLDIRPSADQINDRSISVAQLCRKILAAPRFRSSVSGSGTDSCRSSKRPHSVISMSSVSTSSSSGSSAASNSTAVSPGALLSTSFDSCPSPKPYHRSGTLNSQCSTESGIIADISLGPDDLSNENQHNLHWPLEKSNSQHSSVSQKSDDTQIPNYAEDTTINV